MLNYMANEFVRNVGRGKLLIFRIVGLQPVKQPAK
jgi:hypothetical protein